MRYDTIVVVAALSTGLSAPLPSQASYSLIATLGSDTVQVERFTRQPWLVVGRVVQRMPAVRIVDWRMTFDGEGFPARYQAEGVDANGARVSSLSGDITFFKDSVRRGAYVSGALSTAIVTAPTPAFPGFQLPYLGTTFLTYEWAVRDARRRAGRQAESAMYLITLNAMQRTAQRLRIWFVNEDSAEVDYFGVARSGYRFDSHQELVRADWRGTTYKYQVSRTSPMNVDSIASAWSRAEQSGHGFGPASPRDSVHASVGAVEVTIQYSRPAVRGRAVWGQLVPWDSVWRLGADGATQLRTSADLMIGSTVVPAGRYTLWLVPSRTAPLLVVSKLVDVFGTAYRPTQDFARIPLERQSSAEFVERLTIDIANGSLRVRWGDTLWSVRVGVKSPEPPGPSRK